MVFKQDIAVTRGIGRAPFWENLFLYFFESNQNFGSKKSTRAFATS